MPATMRATVWSVISGNGLLAEREEGQVRAIAEQQELEVVVPHSEVAFERLAVGVDAGRDSRRYRVPRARAQAARIRAAPACGRACASWISAIIFSRHCA